MTLEAPAEPGEVEALSDGRRIRLDSPGRFRSSSSDCIVAPEGWRAVCRLGRGTVTLIADADLMRDSLWAPRRADNPAVVGEWLDELARVSRPRPRPAAVNRNWKGSAALMFALLALLAGITLLLRRRRRR